MNTGETLDVGRGRVPRPARRWAVRLGVPAAIALTVAGLMAYAARGLLSPSIDVWVAPVVVKAAGASEEGEGGTGAVLTQAPGWVEPSPYATMVPAFTEGVVREVLVLEGDRVEAGQVVARLDDRDAKLRLGLAEAELAEARAGVVRARAEAAAAKLRIDELRDDLSRKEKVVGLGGVPEGEVARIGFRVRAAEEEHAAALAMVETAERAVETRRVANEEAALALERTEVKSPSAGVVLSRHVEPGIRIRLSDSGDYSHTLGAVVRLYDPSRLQVRVDVPLADSAKVMVGAPAQITTEALPDVTFEGEVVLVGQEANIQRNTLAFKVRITKPSPLLKPEMQCRVRILSTRGGGGASAGAMRVFASEASLVDRSGDGAFVWRVGVDGRLERREVRTIGAAEDGHIRVEGLGAGDRVVEHPPASLRPGAKVKVRGEKPEGGRA